MVSALRFAALVSVVCAGLACHAAADTRLRVQEVEAFLAREDEKATLEKYFCGEYEDATGAAISRGSPRWAALAVKMLKYSDAGCTTSLLASLGKAMQQNPVKTLPYLGTEVAKEQGTTWMLDTSMICLPFISDELPVAEQLRQLRASKEAISRVRDSKLAEQRKACLDFIDQCERRANEKPSK